MMEDEEEEEEERRRRSGCFAVTILVFIQQHFIETLRISF